MDANGKGRRMHIVAKYVCFASYERYNYLRLWTTRLYISRVIADSPALRAVTFPTLSPDEGLSRARSCRWGVYIRRFKVCVGETAPWWHRRNVLGRQFWTVRPESHISRKLSSFAKLSCVNSIIPEYLDNNVFIKRISLSFCLSLSCINVHLLLLHNIIHLIFINKKL